MRNYIHKFSSTSIAVAFSLYATPSLASQSSEVSATLLATPQSTQTQLGAHWEGHSNAQTHGGPMGWWDIEGFWSTDDWNADINSGGWRFNLFQGHGWLGRALPQIESRAGNSDHRSALGSSWSQNQVDRLSPTPQAWVGGGLHFRVGHWDLDLSATPFFLPHRTGSRYEVPRPTTLRTGGVEYPIEYQIQTPELASVVLQHQAWASFGFRTHRAHLKALAFTAPAPDPDLAISGKLDITRDPPRAVVNVDPSFPRENWVGLSAGGSFLEFQAIRNLSRPKNRLSLRLMFQSLSLGGLHTFSPSQEALVETPAYATGLVWIQWKPLIGRFSPFISAETHLGQGDWMSRAGVGYRISQDFHLFTQAQVLMGADGTYFSQWRAQDMVEVGGSVRW